MMDDIRKRLYDVMSHDIGVMSEHGDNDIDLLDEDGEQNLDASCFADITICETKHNDPALMNRIYNQALNHDIDVTRDYDTVMVNAPDIRENITCRNESSYSGTMMDLSNMFSALTSVLMEYEITKDIDG